MCIGLLDILFFFEVRVQVVCPILTGLVSIFLLLINKSSSHLLVIGVFLDLYNENIFI